MAKPAHKNRSKWNPILIAEIKLNTKTILQEQLKEGAAIGQKKYIIEQFNRLNDNENPQQVLEQFILIVSALVHQVRFGSFSKKEIEHFVEMGEAILLVRRGEKNPHLTTLASEMYSTLSQISFNDQEWWRSFWQLESNRVCNGVAGGPGFHSMTLGITELRIGMASEALRHFEDAERTSEVLSWKIHIRSWRIRCLRMMRQFEPAQLLIAEAQADSDLSAEYRIDNEWENICIEVSKSADLTNMIEAVKNGGTHYQGAYIAESYLWAISMPEPRWINKVGKLRYSAAIGKISLNDLGQFYRSALILSDCYDDELHLSVKLEKLGSMLEKTHQVVTIDRELLLWAAAGRWLMRNNIHELQRAVLKKYSNISRQLSNGSSGDALNIFKLEDLQD